MSDARCCHSNSALGGRSCWKAISSCRSYCEPSHCNFRSLDETVARICRQSLLRTVLVFYTFFLSKTWGTKSCKGFLHLQPRLITYYYTHITCTVRMYLSFKCICAFHTFSWALESYLQQVRTSWPIHKHPSLETPCSQVALRRKSTGIAMSTWLLE